MTFRSFELLKKIMLQCSDIASSRSMCSIFRAISWPLCSLGTGNSAFGQNRLIAVITHSWYAIKWFAGLRRKSMSTLIINPTELYNAVHTINNITLELADW